MRLFNFPHFIQFYLSYSKALPFSQNHNTGIKGCSEMFVDIVCNNVQKRGVRFTYVAGFGNQTYLLMVVKIEDQQLNIMFQSLRIF